jgi:hypothetical protein
LTFLKQKGILQQIAFGLELQHQLFWDFSLLTYTTDFGFPVSIIS